MTQRHLVWFRNDLRIDDNRALAAATAADGHVIAIISPCYGQWRQHGHGANKLDFWYRCARSLQRQLARLNIPLLVVDTVFFSNLPDALVNKAQQTRCTHLHFNDEYGFNEQQRDIQVTNAAKKAGIHVHRYTDAIQFTPGELLTGKGDFYSVFTPFAKAWHRSLEREQLLLSPTPDIQPPIDDVVGEALRAPEVTIRIDIGRWPAGSEEAQRRLSQFIQDRMARYAEDRDFPHITGTSTLSPYLAVGAISSRQCLNAVLHGNHGHLADGDNGASSWVNELVWREFYQHIMIGFPYVCKHYPFRPEGSSIRWRNNKNELKEWQEGHTGYPIIDAAMRQLVATGWMHNRLRMVVAMFLSKHLLIDWRQGEAFFLEHLIDGEFGANNGGWQWASSTGTDASPYFRLFNPTTQSQRFDKQGKFISQWLEGFDRMEAKSRHAPGQEQRIECGYPAQIVDHKAARERALGVFADAFKHKE